MKIFEKLKFCFTDDYTGPKHMSRSGSRDSLGSPWMRSRASSVDSITKHWSCDEDYDVHPIRSKCIQISISHPSNQKSPYKINTSIYIHRTRYE